MPVSLSEGRAAAERKDRPIIFSAPMVRALLEGRKTQTRRIVKRPMNHFHASYTHVHQDGDRFVWSDGKGGCQRVAKVPGAVGDRLWVKEVVAAGACAPLKPSEWAPSFWRREQGTPANPNGLWYAADDLVPERTITTRGRWVSPIFMPRWASRLTLIVESVRVERLQDICGDDVVAEGAWPSDQRQLGRAHEAIAAYAALWNSIHGTGAWQANPWVAALTFRPIPQNIDSLGASA